jgi:hypothetical protein
MVKATEDVVYGSAAGQSRNLPGGSPEPANWATSYKLFPPTSQLLTVMVIGVLAPLTPPP